MTIVPAANGSGRHAGHTSSPTLEASHTEITHRIREITHAMECAGFQNVAGKFEHREHSGWLTDGTEMGITETAVSGRVVGYDVVHRGVCLMMLATVTEAVSQLLLVHGRPTIVTDIEEFKRELVAMGNRRLRLPPVE